MLSPKRVHGSTGSGVEKVKIGYLGSDCSFTSRAAKRFFSQNEREITWESISSCRAIFQHISSGDLSYGVVPIESSSHGTIAGPYDQFLKQNGEVKIVAETVEMEKYCLSVSHPSVSEDSLSRVISHPTILEDCSDFFDSLDRKRIAQGLSPIERIPAIDSAAACKTLVTLPDPTETGVVCCQEAAELYNLRVIAPSIGNDRNSETRYLIIAKFSEGFVDPFGLSCATASREDLKATLSLSLKNISGAMFRMTSCFALRDLNVYKVETRPSSAAIGLQGVQASGDRFKHWDLIFFIDYQPSDHEAINEALRRNLEEYSVWVVDLGVYRQYGQRQTITEPSEWTNMVDILATA